MEQRTRGGEPRRGAESEECRVGEGGGQQRLVLSVAAASEQWLGKLMRLCVIILSTRYREGRWARRIVSEEQGAESPGVG